MKPKIAKPQMRRMHLRHQITGMYLEKIYQSKPVWTHFKEKAFSSHNRQLLYNIIDQNQLTDWTVSYQ